LSTLARKKQSGLRHGIFLLHNMPNKPPAQQPAQEGLFSLAICRWLVVAHLNNIATHVVSALTADVVGQSYITTLRACHNLTRLFEVVCSSFAGTGIGMSSLWDCHLCYSKIEAKLMFLGPKRVPSPLDSVKALMAQNLSVPTSPRLLTLKFFFDSV
jgi:hypothetical protein